MKPKHTPGPWAISARRIFAVTGGSSDGIAHVVDACAGNDSYEIEQANARLIAAAPDMLEALIETLSCIDSWTDDPVVGPIIEQARYAIAKATGGVE